MRSLVATSVLCLVSSCLLFDSGGGHQCLRDLSGEKDVQPAPQRDPETLICESFGGPPCDPSCGLPCPAVGAADQPAVSWGFCGSPCEALDEATCATSDTCRVVREARCAVSGTCTTDFLGCFPTDQTVDPTIDCASQTDGFSCSRSVNCTALHRNDPCPLDAPCPETFAMCIPEGSDPGHCTGPVACDALPPTCPANTTPGISGACWSGFCIPNDICEVAAHGAS